MSHYQSYLKAIGKDQEQPRTQSPASSINRKPTPSSFGQNSPSPMYNEAATTPASVRSGSHSYTPASTAPSTAPPRQPLASHKPASPSPAPSPAPAAASTTSAAPSSPAVSSTLTPDQISTALRMCLALQTNASTYHSKRPFAALLLAPDHGSILLTHFSISHIRHAESELARLASDHFSPSYLSQCTLVSTWEPCAMCAGTIYWSGIGRVMYAASEEKLKQLTGEGNEENMTMSLPCRAVLRSGQRSIEVIGPVSEWEEKVMAESRRWWQEHTGSRGTSIRENGTPSRNGHAMGESGSVVTTWTGEDSVLSSIGEDGEYKADLDIDWMR